MQELERIKALTENVILNSANLPYINLTERNSYAGWVKDFHIFDKNTHTSVSLDLHNEKDLFLLFVLASCWSRSGQWEWGASFVVYLKTNDMDTPEIWKDKLFVESEKEKRKISAKQFSKTFSIPQRPDPNRLRKDISFRSDFYDSISVIANQWEK